MDTQCAACENNYFDFLAKYHRNNEASLQYLRDHGVLPVDVQCPHCKTPCHYRKDRHQWVCGAWTKIAKTKRRKQCNFTVSDYKGTFLSGTRLEPFQILSFVNHWLSKHWDHQTVIGCLHIAERTSVDWRSFCSEVTEQWLDNQEPIGGPGIVVEVDETLFGKRKYEIGRLLSQIWVFGGIERVSKKLFLVPLVELLSRKRDAETLIPLINKYILPGSVIVSDGWSAYRTISKHGYEHQVINHTEHFVNPENPEIHTQNIERLWRDVKEWSKRPGNRQEFYK
ncbi:uncharacterized protein [Penaeus vannamei]|uniref:uncharacterized protein n=1 Tax=Penaeus vannamei TaxID=6689 RepID=UPI000F662B1C|nr:uncharacterized protein LOC113810781 [Penaeus vannamei]